MIDNIEGKISRRELLPFISKVCARGLSIGADGLIVLEPAVDADFFMYYYNSDGSEAGMCGNGAGCAARFAYESRRAGAEMSFMSRSGLVRAEICGQRLVKVQLPPYRDLKLDGEIMLAEMRLVYSYVDTGVPHIVIFTAELESLDVASAGHILRHHPSFGPEGVSVDFASVEADGSLSIRTYERGMEAETLVCGTGAVAAAVVALAKGLVTSPVPVHTRGGMDMFVYKEGASLYLKGEVRLLAKGTILEEALIYGGKYA